VLLRVIFCSAPPYGSFIKTFRARLACDPHYFASMVWLRTAAAAQDTEAGGLPSADPYRSTAAVGLGGKYYMSAYKTLLQQT